jgi:hypothetical protein
VSVVSPLSVEPPWVVHELSARWDTAYDAPRGVWVILPAPTMICRVTRNGMSTSASRLNSPERLTR